MTTKLEIIDIEQWVDDNKVFFVPPVCNKLMYGAGQLKVMFIGGPNQRKDYHIEEGEELFYQLKGPKCLKVVEKNEHKDIPIAEGEIFLLPSRIPHSPQRYTDTVGLVIERERSESEMDGLRYYVDGTVDPLWEEWFHCYDLGTQLGPVINKYFASEEHKTGKPPEGKVFEPPPVAIDKKTATMAPFNLAKWITDHQSDITENGSKTLFSKGEFQVVVWGGEIEQEGKGEAFIWQLNGSSEISCDRGSGTLSGHSCTLIITGEIFRIKPTKETIGITVTIDPLANK